MGNKRCAVFKSSSTEGRPNIAGFVGYKHNSTLLKQHDRVNKVDKHRKRNGLKDLNGCTL